MTRPWRWRSFALLFGSVGRPLEFSITPIAGARTPATTIVPPFTLAVRVRA